MAVKTVVAPESMISGPAGLSKESHDASGGVEVGGGAPRAEGRTKAAPDTDPREMDHRCLTLGCCS